MKKLTKEHKRQQQEHVTAISAAHSTVAAAITAFNAATAKEWESVKVALDAYNARVNDANTFLSGLADEAEKYQNDRTDDWAAGEKGEAYQAWIETLREPLEVGEIDAPEAIEVPDDASSDLADRDDGP